MNMKPDFVPPCKGGQRTSFQTWNCICTICTSAETFSRLRWSLDLDYGITPTIGREFRICRLFSERLALEYSLGMIRHHQAHSSLGSLATSIFARSNGTATQQDAALH